MASKRTSTGERAARRASDGNGRDAELGALRSALASRLTTDLVDRLGTRGIHTLGDLGAAGGIQEATRNLRDLKVGPRLADELDAHVRLSTLPTTAAVNARLIKAGFTSLDRIADAPRDGFVAKVGRRVGGAEKAAALHAVATAQSQFLSNVLTGERVQARPGGAAGTGRAVDAVSPELCDCDCRDATSPVAYLADLLDYAIKHLRSVVFSAGLRGEYFADTSFGTKALDQVDATVNFDWGTGSPAAALPSGRLLSAVDRDGEAAGNGRVHLLRRGRRRRPWSPAVGGRAAGRRRVELGIGRDSEQSGRAVRVRSFSRAVSATT